MIDLYLIMVDREQIVFKLKTAIEEDKVRAFEQECHERIRQIDTYIKVSLANSMQQKLCKNNYTEFLEAL